jgi:hypothetical protein
MSTWLMTENSTRRTQNDDLLRRTETFSMYADINVPLPLPRG